VYKIVANAVQSRQLANCILLHAYSHTAASAPNMRQHKRKCYRYIAYYLKNWHNSTEQGRRQKNFQGGQRKKRPKNSKKNEK